MKLLVANRSEIACRVFQAARELGISTVAIFAPGDESARHLTYADEIAPVPSYLDIDAIVSAARKHGAELIHPGYGFLSERPAFANAVEKAGFRFLGPKAETMELLGGKIAAKELAAQHGVPTLPWAKVESGGGEAVQRARLIKEAERIGFPLLIKASAGGGGKGMRRVDHVQELEAAAESAAAEVGAAFGDSSIFLEKLVLEPRHIEVQVFGDGRGEGAHLFERECTLQRRHQKIWEEAPAPHLPERTRQGLIDSALRLVRATRYRSAGTVEFLVDSKGEYFFLEMNTRLQVEHPVTEQVTGVDLVVAQIELALGSKQRGWDWAAGTPVPRGHAIEVRLYAEDPANGYIPTPGPVLDLRWPTGPGIRIESGVEVGQVISTQFDSMLAKLIVWASDRNRAIARLRFALDETAILGPGTNQSFLRALCDRPEVIAGRVSTAFLDVGMGDFASRVATFTESESSLISSAMRSGLAVGGKRAPTRWASPWFTRGGTKAGPA